MGNIRKIIHIDMDAFFASVEQRDKPWLKGKPVVVGGHPNLRGVVSTCSYEARKFGIHSAMASLRAYILCPHAIFVMPRFQTYKKVSMEVMKIFNEYTEILEPLSLDEAFLDVTINKKNLTSATIIAGEILDKIYQKTKLTASAGVSFNKFLAKVASDIKKPNGLTVIEPENALKFIEKLPIRKFFGVGKVTEKKMLQVGIKTGAELKKFSRDQLVFFFGKSGNFFYDCVQGKDNRPVEKTVVRKSIGKETTFDQDINDIDQILQNLEKLAFKVESIMKRYKNKGRTITLKVKYFDFKIITRNITLPFPVKDASVIIKNIRKLLNLTKAGEKKVRLLGIYVTNFIDESELEGKFRQLYLPFEVE